MPKTAATLIFRKHLFLFQQAFKQQCVLFHSSTEAVALGLFCKKSVLENFAKFSGKCLCKSLFLIKLQA